MQVDNGILDSEGEYTYPIQNCLKEGYSYVLQIEEGIVRNVRESKILAGKSYEPPIKGVPGVRTLKNLLLTAFMPVGTTLYVYGGGWDWQDKGSAIQARTIGVSDDWVGFFRSQDMNYTYKDRAGDEKKENLADSYYPYGGYNEYYYAGLDCSGYVGWILYNVMNTESGLDGYVMPAVKMARTFSEKGWGTWTQNISVFIPGDVISIKGHVWICVGTCADGSILILHSTPALSRTGQPGGGPELSALGKDENCEAYFLADYYMSKYYPEWYERYPVALKDYHMYTMVEGGYAGKFSWNLTGKKGGITDPEGFRNMMPEKILRELFH